MVVITLSCISGGLGWNPGGVIALCFLRRQLTHTVSLSTQKYVRLLVHYHGNLATTV